MSLVALVAAGPAAGQSQPAGEPTSREAEIVALQAEKARNLVPEGPNRIEQYIRRAGPVIMGTQPSGFYPWFGNVFGGGWLAFGAGYRTTYADTGVLNVFSGYSLKNYRMVQADAHLPTFLDGKAHVALHGEYLYADKVSFYGLGNESEKDDRSTYTWEPTTFGATLNLRPVKFVYVGGGYTYQHANTRGGKRDPSIEDEYDDVTAPGIGQDLQYNVLSGYAAFDWRESPGYSSSGGLYRVEFRQYDARDGRPYSFDWTEAEVRQFIPILRGNWVLAFRGVVTLTDPKGGDEIPFFMMPTLGSSRDLRGYSNRRFRDTNRLLLQGEYRWRPSKFMDLVAFYDMGKVAERREDLDLDDLHNAYGFGVRLHGPTSTAVRVELAKSKDGLKLIFSTGIF